MTLKPAQRWHLRTAGLFFLAGLLSLWVALTGCGNKKDDGIEAVLLADTSGTGIGDQDNYPDQFITPSSIKVGLRSVKLIRANETKPSYTIYDSRSDTLPLILDLTDAAQVVNLNPDLPTNCPCEFSKIEAAFTFFDIQIPVHEDPVAIERRIRFYTLSLTDPALTTPVKAGEVLIGNLSNSPAFQWINTADGAYVPLASDPPTVPLQVPVTRFPDNQYSSIVTVELSPFLEFPEKPKGTTTVVLTLQVGGLFFYDETDDPPNGRFDRFSDGRLNANEFDSHFYPGFPIIQAAIEE